MAHLEINKRMLLIINCSTSFWTFYLKVVYLKPLNRLLKTFSTISPRHTIPFL